ncbi:MAG: dicarboxylate/amino acid:cation symporter [Candidatus Cryptobacteroides sp.]
MKKFKLGLLGWIILAIALGIGVGMIAPLWLVRIFVTFNGIFSQFLGFAIPLIILGLVTAAIADIGKSAGKMLLVTIAIAYFSTIGAGFMSYFTADSLFPSFISPSDVEALRIGDTATPYFGIDIPPLTSVMTALVLAFCLGLGIASTGNKPLATAADGFKDLVSKIISAAIIPVLPVYIFGIFLKMTYEGQAVSVMSVFIKIIGIIFALHVLLLLIQFCIAGAVARRNPFKLLWNMFPAYMTALGTQSSAATIPVTLSRTVENGVSKEIAGFTVPLCATIHMSGSMLKITACALALMLLGGMPYSFPMFAGFICMLAITMIAAPGVPGGCIMASLGLLESMLGFDADAQALMIALYIAMDSFGTACNVTGDGAIAVIVDRIFGKRLVPSKTE